MVELVVISVPPCDLPLQNDLPIGLFVLFRNIVNRQHLIKLVIVIYPLFTKSGDVGKE